MKILCVSDHIDPLVYSVSIKDRFGGAAFVLAAGDLPLDYLDFIVSSLNKPLYFVFGNHNLEHFARYTKRKEIGLFPPDLEGAGCAGGAVYIGGKVTREEGLIIAGLGGSMRYNNGENQWTEAGMALRMLGLVPALIYNKLRHGRFLDILLTHASPSGIHDKPDLCHRGFKCFRVFMRLFKPRYLIHGHIHLYDAAERRLTQFMDTQVVNVYNHYIVEV